MPRKAAGMTARQAATISRKGLHAAGGVAGLLLEVSGTGGRSWVFRYMTGGRRRSMGLGSFEVISLAEAREKAAEARRQLAAGVDPLDRRRAERAGMAVAAAKAVTFKQCAIACHAALGAGWRSQKGAAQWIGSLELHAFPAIGSLPVAAIDTALVMAVLSPIWAEKTETADRVRNRIETVLDWAKTSGYRDGTANPAVWRGNLENLLPKKSRVHAKEHFAALPYADVPTFIAALRARKDKDHAARALELQILCALRPSEAAGALWPEFNLAERLWIIPAERMKNGREHRVPLSDAAMAILETMAANRSTSDYVFGKPVKQINGQVERLLNRKMKRSDITAHGFRSSFRDWCGELTAYPREVAEAALAHRVGDAVELSYRRGDALQKRRQLMESWAKFCANPTEESAKVVSIRG